MPKLLRRDKAPKSVDPEVIDAVEALNGDAEAPPEPVPPPPPVATAGDPAPPASRPENGNEDGNGNGYQTIKTSGSLFSRMYGEPGERSRADRDRQAAMEFEQAVAPVMDMLQGSVPGAASPQEAAQTLESRVGELRPDPGAGAYIPGDRYDREARVYYRLLRRDYEKNPRPSLSRNRKSSHSLGTTYKQFPGTRGW